MKFLFIFILISIVSAFLTWLILRTPRNSNWKICMYCKDCNAIYNQSGLHPSVYTCSNCGKETKHYVFRRVNGKYEVKPRR